MSYPDSDMSFTSDNSDIYNRELSEEEESEFDAALMRTKERIEEIKADVRLSKRHKRNMDIIYIDDHPHIYSNGRYIRTLRRFNYTADLAYWVNKRSVKNNFDEWLSVPRSSRVPYSPLNVYGQGTWSTKGIEFNYVSLLVKNLSVKTTGFQLREIFSQYGFVRDVYIPINHSSGEKCNYAFIEIYAIDGIETVLNEMTQFGILNGKPMQVQIAVSGRRSAMEMKARYTIQTSANILRSSIKHESGRFNIIF